MNWASARCWAARPPFISVKRAPEIFTAVSKSARPGADVHVVAHFEVEAGQDGAPAADFDVVFFDLPGPARSWRQVGQAGDEGVEALHQFGQATSLAFIIADAATSASTAGGILAPLPLRLPNLLGGRCGEPGVPGCGSGGASLRSSSSRAWRR